MASVHKRGTGYQVRWKEPRPGGGWATRSATFPDAAAAKRFRAEVERARADNRPVLSPKEGAGAGVEAMIDGYLQHLARTKAGVTTATYGTHLEVFTRYLHSRTRVSVLPPSLLTFQTLADYHEWLADPATGRRHRARTDDTRAVMVHTVERFWQWAFTRQRRGDWTGLDYPDSLEVKRVMPRDNLAPTWPQMDAAVLHATGWRRDLLFVLRCTGLRVRQALGLRWDDVDLRAGVLHVRGELGKSHQERAGRWIPLAPVLVEELAAWGAREGFLVPCGRAARSPPHRGTQLDWTAPGAPPALWARRPHHAFRKGFATELKRAGADGEAIDFLIGHTAASTRGRHYTDPRAHDLVAAVAMVPRLAAPNLLQLRLGEG